MSALGVTVSVALVGGEGGVSLPDMDGSGAGLGGTLPTAPSRAQLVGTSESVGAGDVVADGGGDVGMRVSVVSGGDGGSGTGVESGSLPEAGMSVTVFESSVLMGIPSAVSDLGGASVVVIVVPGAGMVVTVSVLETSVGDGAGKLGGDDASTDGVDSVGVISGVATGISLAGLVCGSDVASTSIGGAILPGNSIRS